MSTNSAPVLFVRTLLPCSGPRTRRHAVHYASLGSSHRPLFSHHHAAKPPFVPPPSRHHRDSARTCLWSSLSFAPDHSIFFRLSHHSRFVALRSLAFRHHHRFVYACFFSSLLCTYLTSKGLFFRPRQSLSPGDLIQSCRWWILARKGGQPRHVWAETTRTCSQPLDRRLCGCSGPTATFIHFARPRGFFALPPRLSTIGPEDQVRATPKAIATARQQRTARTTPES